MVVRLEKLIPYIIRMSAIHGEIISKSAAARIAMTIGIETLEKDSLKWSGKT